jgi:hypothetical protein
MLHDLLDKPNKKQKTKKKQELSVDNIARREV